MDPKIRPQLNYLSRNFGHPSCENPNEAPVMPSNIEVNFKEQILRYS